MNDKNFINSISEVDNILLDIKKFKQERKKLDNKLQLEYAKIINTYVHVYGDDKISKYNLIISLLEQNHKSFSFDFLDSYKYLRINDVDDNSHVFIYIDKISLAMDGIKENTCYYVYTDEFYRMHLIDINDFQIFDIIEKVHIGILGSNKYMDLIENLNNDIK